MDRLETRELTYFVAVAEELHFGRAAQRLGIAQPPLSRAIRQVERRIGVPLLDRTSRRVALTPAGEVMLHEARKALDAVSAAGQRARRAGQPDRRLVLVMKPGGDAGLLPEILAQYEPEPDALPMEIHICGIAEQAGLLRQGQADVGLLHRPYDDLGGFDTEDLLVERHVLVIAEDHRFAGRDSVTMAELAGEPQPRFPGQPVADPAAPLIRDSGQLMQLIALGRLVAVLPASSRERLPAGLVTVPIADAPTSTVVAAWPERSWSRAVAAFARAAATVARTRTAATVATTGQPSAS
ncbi:LysR family transcriptional regulator [Plantactinospora sp. GCM10030261]|uniref:LysR family transcriptional regulator n=1 Tax=Plantactinospora sp. GCM10030261 TaxID=3273420 RepID=UPI00361665A9